MRRLLVMLAIVLVAASAHAAGKSFRLAVDPALIENSFSRYLLARFSLKTGVKVAVTPLDPAVEADAALGAFEAPPEGPGALDTAIPVFETTDGARQFRLALYRTRDAGFAQRFRDWLSSEIGRRTLTKFKVDGAPVYAAIEATAPVVAEAAPTGDAATGEELALKRCGRCHVINEKNRFGGIDSTPSFGALRTLPEWRGRFEAFWTLNPHRAFTQVAGVTEPFDPTRPPPIAPLHMTLAEIDAILAFVIAMKPKDLGAPLHEK